MGKCRAVNEFVNTILGDSFSVKYTPKQLVLVLRESSKYPDVQMLFKSAGLTDVEDLEALRFHNEQIHRILQKDNK
jgi:DNA polymerase I-like protein with 3'-5' exonuclease and polymerase domains